MTDEGAEQINENPVRLANTGQDLGVDQGAEHNGGNTGFQGAAVDAHGDLGGFLQRVDERQADRLEIDLFELGKHRLAEGLSGDAGTVGNDVYRAYDRGRCHV
ncbi:hypothetical protein G6F24_018358 [Rhizopus arrhizus]|nr:hypothetical protein G6F24_018358 [Rhizopus arrhizus]